MIFQKHLFYNENVLFATISTDQFLNLIDMEIANIVKMHAFLKKKEKENKRRNKLKVTVRYCHAANTMRQATILNKFLFLIAFKGMLTMSNDESKGI